MRLTVELGGRTTTVEVSDDLATVRVGDRQYPVRIVAHGPTRVELEIGGETAIVDGWPDRHPSPPGPVDINGERWPVSVRAEEDLRAPRPAPGPAAPARPGPGPTGAAGPPAAGPSGAVAVMPPMPGRVVEVKVHEGDVVAKGTVVLVLEAMKMRSEVTAPLDGVVKEIRVREGSNVRAREPMLFLAPK